MRPILLLLVVLLFTAPSFGQEIDVETYLVVRISRHNDFGNPYYAIDAEPFNNNALSVYELESFKLDNYLPKKGISFYYNRPDTATRFYNYFKSVTEALDFMGSQRWTLVNVISEISSGHNSTGFGDK